MAEYTDNIHDCITNNIPYCTKIKLDSVAAACGIPNIAEDLNNFGNFRRETLESLKLSLPKVVDSTSPMDPADKCIQALMSFVLEIPKFFHHDPTNEKATEFVTLMHSTLRDRAITTFRNAVPYGPMAVLMADVASQSFAQHPFCDGLVGEVTWSKLKLSNHVELTPLMRLFQATTCDSDDGVLSSDQLIDIESAVVPSVGAAIFFAGPSCYRAALLLHKATRKHWDGEAAVECLNFVTLDGPEIGVCLPDVESVRSQLPGSPDVALNHVCTAAAFACTEAIHKATSRMIGLCVGLFNSTKALLEAEPGLASLSVDIAHQNIDQGPLQEELKRLTSAQAAKKLYAAWKEFETVRDKQLHQ